MAYIDQHMSDGRWVTCHTCAGTGLVFTTAPAQATYVQQAFSANPYQTTAASASLGSMAAGHSAPKSIEELIQDTVTVSWAGLPALVREIKAEISQKEGNTACPDGEEPGDWEELLRTSKRKYQFIDAEGMRVLLEVATDRDQS